MTLCISTHKYDILSFCELSEKQQAIAMKEFDWVEDIENSHGFFIYKKALYNLGSFIRHNAFMADDITGKKFYAHGIYSWSAFHGLALEFMPNDSALKIAYYY